MKPWPFSYSCVHCVAPRLLLRISLLTFLLATSTKFLNEKAQNVQSTTKLYVAILFNQSSFIPCMFEGRDCMEAGKLGRPFFLISLKLSTLNQCNSGQYGSRTGGQNQMSHEVLITRRQSIFLFFCKSRQRQASEGRCQLVLAGSGC